MEAPGAQDAPGVPGAPARPSLSTGEFRRLHPLTPVVRGARGIGVVGALVSYQAWGAAGVGALAFAAAVIVVVWFVLAWVSWRFTGFRVEDRELHITEGVLARRHRTVPLERVQAVDVVRPLLARILGLAEVRMEVVGGGKEAEAPLAYLAHGEADQFRVHLLRLAADAGAPTAPVTDAPSPTEAAASGDAVTVGVAEGTGTAAPARLFTVDGRRLLLSQLLTLNTLSVPFLAVFPIMEFAGEDPSVTAVVTFLSGIIGVVQVPVRRVLNEWGFQLGVDADGLRIHRGLLDVRNQTVPFSRIQAVRIRRPLLWRAFGWIRVEIDVAGYGGDQSGGGRSTLIPVALDEEGYQALHRVLPTVPDTGPEAFGLRPAPRAARRRVPVQARQLGYAVTDELLVARRGWFTPRYDIALLARAQSVRASQGPWQRALGLMSVHLDTAGDRTSPTVAHRDPVEAAEILATLVARAHARRTHSP